MKKRKIFIIVFAITVFIIYLIYWGYDKWPTQNWREYRSLVRIWPRLKKEKIESIRFTQAINWQNETFFQETVSILSFRIIDANIVKEWPSGCEVPKNNIPECITIIDKIVKNTQRPWWLGGTYRPICPSSKMLIVTDKGRYIVLVEADISKVAGPKVYGEEWMSYELGKFLAKYCFPDIEYKYSFPSKEQVVAILIYPPKFSPPLAIFGDKKLAEELLFKTEFHDDPNGIQGIGRLYKFTRLRTFGVEAKEENRKIVTNNELKPKKVFEGRDWLEKIMDAYEVALKEAERNEKYYPGGPDPF